MQNCLLHCTCYVIAFLSLPCGMALAQNDSGKLLAEMKELCRQTVVNVKTGDGLERAQLIPTPIFRYSDQPRRIPDASLWAWVHAGRLVAFQKIEANQRLSQPRWTYCLASFSSLPLEVDWPNRDRFKTTGREVDFRIVPNAPAPSEKPFVRLQQVKQMARRFSATIENLPDGSNSERMRLLPRPVFLYPEQPALPTLAVFGFASNGTNPDAYLVLQAEADGDRLKWTYGVRRMTTGGVSVKFDRDMVWEADWIDAVGGPVGMEGWIFFFEYWKQD